MSVRKTLTDDRRWVIKVGSALVTDNGQGLDHERIRDWVRQMVAARERGVELVMVSSGSVAEGVQRLGWPERPSALHQLQAAAAVGQMGLVQAYESEFQRYGLKTAQVLLTHEDLADRQRYLNARVTLRALLELGVIPVVNENDTVATEEIRFGDNDTLAALVSNLIEADLLVILTDQPGLFDRDPRAFPEATLVDEAAADDAGLLAMCSDAPGVLGSGGMRAKVLAARRAARAGAATLIASGRDTGVLEAIATGHAPGTLLTPSRERLVARKQWIAGQLQVQGKLWLDAGAVAVLRDQGRSLLAVGVTGVEGVFGRGDLVACLDPQGQEVARGLVNYDSSAARTLAGSSSDQIEALLGYVTEPELVHRDNLVLTA
ncbi:glutamate 5-kinase [Spiribacter salinus]|jgi:glutamate 5-kinase|uniref:Glutamate 5-kinase n=1 Tax=Spiribacter salinus TaxID=1335746 RepID=A0A540VVK4_9GAMM|nr:glutamate 5-kinase [Spiribacter salinus]MBY5269029.1 glutamate 5-kinase [Spiribacter salinus]MDR9413170.1 glutamate 5-kinase [Spiribacter sp.]MDR9454727.1 glutamate 5-kinase [Spiribacter sp.]TQF00789.1 MAG: glutamate 5-kinase [Spiribacter salinus]